MKYVLAVVLCACAVFCFAQAPTSSAAPATSTVTPRPAAPSPQVANPVTASLRMLLTRSQNNTVGSIEAMPADKFSYKPTPDQMTFGHLVVHMINSNNMLCAKVADFPAPKVDEPKESDSKESLVAAAKASFAFCNEALNKMDDSKLSDSVQLWGGRESPRAMAALALASGWADHYAAAAMYLRLNGILPPSAQPKK